MIIGLSGKKYSGKDSIADYCAKRCWEDDIADGYKEHVIMGLHRLYLTYFCDKNTPVSILNDQKWKDEIGWNGKTHRENLVQIGNDGRRWWPEIWIEYFKRSVPDGDDMAIFVTGVRYPNEVKAIQDMGGKVLRLTRNVHDDQHESETALDTVEANSVEFHAMRRRDFSTPNLFDAILDNSSMGIEEQNEKAWKIIRRWINDL
jgi:hypothetical protein